MNREDRQTQGWREAGLLLMPLLAMLGYAWGSQNVTASLANIEISFKMDPRLTKGVYMGDRWISGPTYSGTVGQDTVEARVRGVDAKGVTVAIRPQWAPSDPGMVTVSPSEGAEVKITVKRAGESRLRVTSGVVSKELAVKAAFKEEVLQVEIAQLEIEAPAQVSSVPDDPAFKSPKERLSYAIGANIGGGVRKQSLAVDLDVLIQGIKDALAGGKMLMTGDQISATLLSAQEEMKKTQTPRIEKLKELAEKNRKEGEAFLAGNKTKEGVVTLESGLQYKILTAGDGQKPTADDTVVCHYRGSLLDGTEFDSSHKRNQPATFPLARVIKGWTESLQLMPVGSKWQIFIPSDLAYGERGAPGGKIGPNSALIFEVELLSIQGKSADVAAGPRPAAPQN